MSSRCRGPPACAKEAPLGETEPARILVIDDDRLVRESLADVLQSVGHEVALAENGEEGLELLDRGPVDLIVLDILMPQREGIETIREVRRSSQTIPVLAISGGDTTGSIDYLHIASALGADATLAKPFSPGDFVARVARLLGERSNPG